MNNEKASTRPRHEKSLLILPLKNQLEREYYWHDIQFVNVEMYNKSSVGNAWRTGL